MNYTISFYNSSVQKEIDRWPTGIYAKFLQIAQQIEKSGPNLGSPYTRALGDELFEIRAKGREGTGRAFFCCVIDREVIILHGFIKKTQKTPLKEIQLARKRLKEVKK